MVGELDGGSLNVQFDEGAQEPYVSETRLCPTLPRLLASKCLQRWITLPSNTQIWIAAGVTDLRRGFTGLSSLVQNQLEQSPLSCQVCISRKAR